MRKFLNKYFDKAFEGILGACWGFSFLCSLLILLILFKDSFQFFSQVSLVEFFTGTEWQPLLEPKRFGVMPLFVGSLHIVVGSLLIAMPISLLVAVYMSEFASHRFRRYLKPVLEVLAGIPTVVYGYFALNFITPVLQQIFPSVSVFNALSAAIVVAIMLVPMISSLTDDALQALPGQLREGAYALGTTPLEVITGVLFPAISGRFFAAVVLAVSRAIGETMAVTLAAGASPNMTWNPLESIQTLTAYIVQVSLGDTPAGGIEYLSCMAVAFVLFVVTFIMNSVGAYWIHKKGTIKL
jgi:phosphate transport system permease protein